MKETGESSSSTERTADHIVDYLSGHAGVRHLFGVHGANIEDVFDAASRPTSAVRPIIAKHEFSTGAMADGYYRVRNEIAVVAVTSGGGALNLLPALGEAYASQIPVLALIGQPPTDLEGKGAFQDQSGISGSLNGRALFSEVSRLCERVDKPGDIAALLPTAVATAQRHPSGPAVLLLPKDVQQAIPGPIEWVSADPVSSANPITPSTFALLRGLARRNAKLMIIAGLGVVRADARDELARLVNTLDASVAVEPDAKDAFDNHDPRFAGVTGVMGHHTVAERLAECEACLIVGTRLPQASRAGLDPLLRDRQVICFHDELPYSASEANTRFVRGALITSLEYATAAAATTGVRASITSQREIGYMDLPTSATEVLTREVVDVVCESLPERTNVIADAGNAGACVAHYLTTPRGGRHVLAMGMGGMGFSFGAGIGATLATGRRSYVLAGDGSFFMHGLEVHTAIEYDLPVTFVVFNNDSHGMCVTREERFYERPTGLNLFRHSDIAAGVGRMFPSLPVLTVRTHDDLDEMRRFFREVDRAAGPALVSVEVAPDEVPPFLPLLPNTA